MDPITAAIVAGVTAGAADVAPQAVKDAYGALKGALKRKFGADSKIVNAVNDVQEEPDYEPNQQDLAGRVKQTNAASDSELLELAKALVEALQTTTQGQQAMSKYNIDVSGGHVGVIGDNAHVKGGIHFGAKPGDDRQA